MSVVWFLWGLGLGLLLMGYCARQQRRSRLHKRQSTLELPSAIAPTNGSEHLSKRGAESIRQILQHAPIGFLQVDEDNQLVWCNARACALLSIEQPPLKRPRLLLELVRSYELDQLIEQTRNTQKSCQQEWTFHPVCADQSRLSQQQSQPLRGYGFLLPGSVGVFLEDRQEAIMLAQQRDRWTSDVAHELKTPLTSIRLVAETLQPRLEPALKSWIDRLLQEVIRLSNLVQDLLDMSHLEGTPKPKLNLTVVDLPKQVQSAWLSLEPLARRKQLTLSYHGADSLPIQADETRLHRVFLNLLDNGIKYSPEGGVIQVGLQALPLNHDGREMVHLEVVDQGAGFPQGTLPHVFDRFYRADPSRRRENMWLAEDDIGERGQMLAGGSGLGLAIVRQIVESHGGSVKASNHPETGGACLEVFLWCKLAEVDN